MAAEPAWGSFGKSRQCARHGTVDRAYIADELQITEIWNTKDLFVHWKEYQRSIGTVEKAYRQTAPLTIPCIACGYLPILRSSWDSGKLDPFEVAYALPPNTYTVS
eukprot:5162903-Amphidinium_carterae.1